MDVVLRPSIEDDFHKLIGNLPPPTTESLTVVYRGEVAAIAGVVKTEHGYVICMEMAKHIDAPKITIWRYARKILSIILQEKNVIYCGAWDKYPNSGKFLRSLGFEFHSKDANGGDIYYVRI